MKRFCASGVVVVRVVATATWDSLPTEMSISFMLIIGWSRWWWTESLKPKKKVKESIKWESYKKGSFHSDDTQIRSQMIPSPALKWYV